jgi:SAM-dependent methyltransferase
MSERARISAITHGDLPFHNPLSAARVDEALGHAGLRPGARVLDVGCGAGELLIRAAERFGATGAGIDDAAVQIEEARRRAAARVPAAGLEFELADARGEDRLGGSFDLVACIGSMHAVEGGLPALAGRLAPGGRVLIGDGFWRREPGQPYLDALGATADELPDLPALIRGGDPAGLEATWAAVTTDEEWDRYEWTLIDNGLRWAREHADDPLAPEVAAWARRGRERVLTPGGRDTLGFALVLYVAQ